MSDEDTAVGAGEVASVPNPELALTHLESLPTLAPIAVRLLQITSDPDSAIEEVTRVLRADQSLTAKLLSVANSAAMGVREPVATLERAVVRLGFSAVRSIVLAVKFVECFSAAPGPRAQRGLQRAEFWKHSLAVACAARRLATAQREREIDPEEAFVAGLLHDLGKVALDTVFPKAYARIAAEGEQTRGDVADCERAVLGVDHTVAGRRLAERWGLARQLQDVIWLHHLAADTLPTGLSCPGLIALVNLADTIAREQRIGYSGNYVFYEDSARIARHLGYSQEDLAGVIQGLVSDVAEQGELLGLNRETPQDLYLKSLRQANTELGRLNAELLASNRQLAVAARYFEAISEFAGQLNARLELPAVVAAVAHASATALCRPRLAAFGLRAGQAAVDISWIGEDPDEQGRLTEDVPADLLEWLRAADDLANVVVTRAPRAIHAILPPSVIDQATGDCWLLPIVHDGDLAGGVVFFSEQDEHAHFAAESEELRSFLAHLGLALGQANAQASARRLSEDLAGANRRLQQTQLQLLRSRTLSMIAEMAAGAGHELNGPLTVISGRAQILRDATADPEMKRSLDLIHSKAHECSRIVSELMDFARPRPPQLTPVDLAKLLIKVRDEWSERSGMPAARLQVHLPETEYEQGAADAGASPAIMADAEQIKRVFGELVANAAHAVATNDGSITIECTVGAVRPSGLARSGLDIRDRPAVHPPATDWVEVVVRDTGIGMDPGVLQRAFDPFYSHRPAGRARGLGLAHAHRIVEAHGGRIWLESRPDEGTTVHVVLPLAQSSSE